jgi:hypothetical protein
MNSPYYLYRDSTIQFIYLHYVGEVLTDLRSEEGSIKKNVLNLSTQLYVHSHDFLHTSLYHELKTWGFVLLDFCLLL